MIPRRDLPFAFLGLLGIAAGKQHVKLGSFEELLLEVRVAAMNIFVESGRFGDGLMVFAWVQVLQILLHIVQTTLMLISMTIAGLVGLFATVLMFWILFGLISAWLELGSMLKAALCFVLGLVALSLGGAFLLVLLGFAPGQVAL